MNFQDASNLRIPEGYVRTIHDKNSRLLWGSVGYDVSFDGNATQQTYTGKNLFDIAQVNNLALGGTILQLNTYRGYSLKVSAGQTYTISRASTSSPGRFRVAFTKIEPANGVVYYDASSVEGHYSGDETDVSITVTVPTEMEYLFVYLSNTNQTITEDMQIQIEQSGTKSAYEPYVGGIPAPNPSYPQPISVVTGENVVKVAGKNLFHFTETRTLTTGGVTFETTEGSSVLKINGTSTSSSNFSTNLIRDASPLTLEAGTYTIKIDGLNRITTTTDYAYLGKVGIGVYVYLNPNNNWQNTFTLTTKTSLYMQGIFASSTVYDNKDVTIQLEQGSTATTYEAFTAQDYEVNLGKNLAKPTSSSGGSSNGITWSRGADGSITISGEATANTSFRIADLDLVKGETYTLSGCPSGGSASTWQLYTNFIAPQFIDYGSGSTKTITNPTESNNPGLFFIVRSGATIDTTFYPQLELGTKATSFAPYFTPLELAKIGTYQDRIYKEGEKWYVEKQVGKVVLDGSENWGFVTLNRGYFQCSYPLSDIVAFDGTPAKNALCDYFTCASRYAVLNTTNLSLNLSGVYCAISYDAFPKTAEGLADFKTWLASNPTTVYYALATPTTTEITDATLVAQLEAVYDWVRRHGYNAQATGDLPIVINRSTLS